MIDPKQNKPNQETEVLHLDKFAPGQAPTEPAPAAPSEEGLTVFIKKAAADAVQESLQPIVSPRDSPLPPKEMLGTLTYAYAKGVYRSEDIERKMRQNPAFRAATHGEVPDAKTIRRFRKLNRRAILDTLAKAFRLRRKKAAAEAMQETLPGAQPASAPATGAGTDGETTLIARKEAEQRLDNAAWVDNMLKDD